ncbi:MULTISPECIES: LysR family transcriptional regulator [unclassified Rhizobium]|uniref:LysR family transcriptional regulator n=1 Tax=unclassified Rhizobium TaxID=2613769 RepID=UPI000EA862D4|nr:MULTISPECIES: LysR family transcriptional regulator [unclassified Rhizobium]AYG69628.1 LysR family transcriptional regulator [Rhizobium sp. CCGE531]AYG76006.1 LysR family transcriptional regulator [Rhizobium sp. CCGE532]
MDLNGAKIFVRVVQMGSFTRAAAELGLPNSTVSDRISDLEKALGVSLLVRTTRKLRLTDAGSIFFKKAELAVAALTSAGEETSSFQQHPSGTLKITAPVDFDYTSVCEAVIEYNKKFPEVRVEMLLTDRLVDLVGEGFDIAIRASPLKDAGFTAKRMGEAGLILVAAPQYLEQSSAISQPGELAFHQCLVILPEQDANSLATWNLVSTDGQKAKIVPRARISSNSVGAIKHLALIGEGIALMPPTLVRGDISRKQLVHVLPGWSTAPWPSYLVYASHRNSSPKVKEMIPLLEPRIRSIIW